MVDVSVFRHISLDISILSEVQYVLCLDSIGGADQLFMHVSKPPKENSPGYMLVEAFKEVSLQNSILVSLVQTQKFRIAS